MVAFGETSFLVRENACSRWSCEDIFPYQLSLPKLFRSTCQTSPGCYCFVTCSSLYADSFLLHHIHGSECPSCPNPQTIVSPLQDENLYLTWALRSSDLHLLQCKGSTLFTTITIQIQATETYFRLTAPIIYRQNLTVPNWRRHKPTASDNRHERHLKLRERRKESPETTAIQVMSLITLVTSNLKQNNKLATNWH